MPKVEDDGSIVALADRYARAWVAPRAVKVEADRVVWSGDGGVVRWSQNALEDFVELADAPTEKIGAFVRRWGALGFCARHQLPHGLAPRPRGTQTEPPCEVDGRTAGFDDGEASEDVDAYRTWAGQARAMLQAAHCIRERARREAAEPSHRPMEAKKRAVPQDLWAAMTPLFSPPMDFVRTPSGRLRATMPLDEEQVYLAEAIQAWLDLARVDIRYTWPAGSRHPGIEVGGAHLFAALAFELALRTTQTTRLSVCEDCGHPFAPMRRKVVARWCPDCRGTASKREQQRKWRAKRKKEQPHD